MSDLILKKATEQDADKVYALYQSLVGTPYCAWDEDYPNLEIVRDDIAAGGLYIVSRGPELLAAGTIRHWCEHDDFACWSQMNNPCDLMRIGVVHPLQGHGIGRFFLNALLLEAERLHYDFMRILVAKTNLPAIALYRNTGAIFCGETFSYGIEWFCAQIPIGEVLPKVTMQDFRQISKNMSSAFE